MGAGLFENKGPKDYNATRTDPLRWRMRSDHGRQTWHYLKTEEEMKEWPQTVADKYFLGLDTGLPNLPKPTTPMAAAENAISFFSKLQVESGNWACDYEGPCFLTPGMVISMYITNTPIPDEWKTEFIRYLVNHVNRDGGWGLHIEDNSTVFGTALNYVVLRICGMEPNHPVAEKARNRLHELGGALYAPQWGKAWLSLLNCYRWEGVNPVPPELWAMPTAVPFHPWRWWIHCRMVYLPLSWLYGKQYYHPENDLIRSLRRELYVQDFHHINFSRYRNSVCEVDVYYPHSKLLNVLNQVLVTWQNWVRPNSVLNYSMDVVKDLIEREDDDSDFVCLGPVNNPLNFIVRYLDDGPHSEAVQKHRYTIENYLYMNKSGMFTNGTDGLQVWDTAFWIQAMAACDKLDKPEHRDSLLRALAFLEEQQIRENCKDQHKSYRHIRKGAWPFSTKKQGYTVSDCTAEAFKGVLLLQTTPGFPKLLDDQRIFDAVDIMLSLQSSDNGFSEYETSRVGEWIEQLNAAEVFGNIMKSYSFPECTTAVITALTIFQRSYPDYRKDDINSCITRAWAFLKKVQRPDGSWFGSWGICFTYATMFALESLHLAGENYENSQYVQRAVHFLLDKQQADGGWGETYKSCTTGQYHHHEKSQLTNTAWACIGLLHADYPDRKPIERGLRLIMSRQRPNGEWLPESIEGVFNRNCMIAYPNYKFLFTTMALGLYVKKWGNPNWSAHLG